MTNHEKIATAKILKAVYRDYGREIDNDVLEMMVGDLDGFSYPQIEAALRKYRTDVKNRFPPRACNVIEIINPQVDDADRAVAIASLATKAVSDFGWSNATAAKEFIGPVGWEAVRRFGGWQYICENLGSELNVNTFMAQIRDIVRADLKISAAGRMGDSALLDYNKPQIDKITDASGVGTLRLHSIIKDVPK